MTSTMTDTLTEAPFTTPAAPAAPAAPTLTVSQHPSAWRQRIELAVVEERAKLLALPAISRASIEIAGDAHHLVLTATCTMASEVVPLEVMRLLNDELPLRLEAAIGLPLVERHLDLSVVDHESSVAA